jgi:hypothetical protein
VVQLRDRAKKALGRPFLTTSFADLDRFKSGARRRLEISIDWLKANPNKASAGIAVSSFHLLTAFFQKETATQFAFVPYRGVARAVQDRWPVKSTFCSVHRMPCH